MPALEWPDECPADSCPPEDAAPRDEDVYAFVRADPPTAILFERVVRRTCLPHPHRIGQRRRGCVHYSELDGGQ
jgi:hypothetical protein